MALPLGTRRPQLLDFDHALPAGNTLGGAGAALQVGAQPNPIARASCDDRVHRARFRRPRGARPLLDAHARSVPSLPRVVLRVAMGESSDHWTAPLGGPPPSRYRSAPRRSLVRFTLDGDLHTCSRGPAPEWQHIVGEAPYGPSPFGAQECRTANRLWLWVFWHCCRRVHPNSRIAVAWTSAMPRSSCFSKLPRRRSGDG